MPGVAFVMLRCAARHALVFARARHVAAYTRDVADALHCAYVCYDITIALFSRRQYFI